MKKLLAVSLTLIAISIFGLYQLASADTYINRVGAISNALVDGAATTEQKLALANAFVEEYRDYITALGYDPDALTNEQKSQLTIIKLKEYVKTLIRRHHTGVKTAKETLETAQAGIASADATAQSETDTAWIPEAIEPVPEP